MSSKRRVRRLGGGTYKKAWRFLRMKEILRMKKEGKNGK
jgi:hypothetical protein